MESLIGHSSFIKSQQENLARAKAAFGQALDQETQKKIAASQRQLESIGEYVDLFRSSFAAKKGIVSQDELIAHAKFLVCVYLTVFDPQILTKR